MHKLPEATSELYNIDTGDDDSWRRWQWYHIYSMVT